MTGATKEKYAVCEKKAFRLVFAFKNLKIYILGADTFKLVTSHQALNYVFKKKDVHGLPVLWLERFAEYEFDIFYNPEAGDAAAEYLLR